MKILTPLILIALSIGLFFVFINPQYSKAKELSTKIEANKKMIILANQLRDEQSKLEEAYKNISPKERDTLKKILPDTVDNVRLILDINNIANDFGINLANIGIGGEDNQSGGSGAGQSTGNRTTNTVDSAAQSSKYGIIQLSFSVTSSYENFKAFMERLENSLRLVDITDFRIQAGAVNPTGQQEFNYSVSINTYWLK